MVANNWSWAQLFVRWILGLLFLMAGYWKVFVLTPAAHAQRFFVDGFADTWIPQWLLVALGYAIPFLELIAGILIFVGLRSREALIAVGLLLVATAPARRECLHSSRPPSSEILATFSNF